MKLTINTDEFKGMISKATKGASTDNNVYITQLMALELKDNVFTVTTTDTNNYLYIRKSKVAGSDFYAVVPVDKFAKLISKITCDKIILETSLSDSGDVDKLIVKGNGRYVIELPYDVDGELVEFPDPVSDINLDSDEWRRTEVKLSTIQLLLTTAKASLTHIKDLTNPYTGYYVGDKIVTTDSYKICGVYIDVFDEPKLISAEMMDLLDVVTDEDISVAYNDTHIVFYTDSCVVYGNIKDGVEQFKIDAISSLLDEPFASSCVVDKSSLLHMLDRLSLFVNIKDKNGVRLTFTRDGLNVSSKQKSGDEMLPYIESDNFTDYSCCVDIGMFIAQIKANRSPTIKIFYGKDATIKFTDGPVTQILALADDEGEDGE